MSADGSKCSDGTLDRHEKRCREYLEGKTTDELFLWCSVGFFYAGRASHEKNPFTEEEWNRLLVATERL